MKESPQSKANPTTAENQLLQANLVLKGLKGNITSEDRKKAVEVLGLNRLTIGKYIKGNGKDLTTAFALIDIFKGRIDERQKRLAAVMA